MSRARITTDDEGRFCTVEIRCPAGHRHSLPTDWVPPGMERSPHYAGPRPRWGFNGDLDRPTFTPSIRQQSGHHLDGTSPADCRICKQDADEGVPPFCRICHSFVRDGRIQFLSDCTHALAGQTVDLPEIEV